MGTTASAEAAAGDAPARCSGAFRVTAYDEAGAPVLSDCVLCEKRAEDHFSADELVRYGLRPGKE